MFIEVIRWIGYAIQGIGIGLIAWFSIEAVAQLAQRAPSETVRHAFARRILLALEFFIAAEMIHVTLASDPADLILLGGIVIIRAVLGYAVRNEATPDKARKQRFL